MIRGNGIGMDDWGKIFPSNHTERGWFFQIHACKGSEYKMFLMTPLGDIIPEEGPNRSIFTLHPRLKVPAPVFTSL